MEKIEEASKRLYGRGSDLATISMRNRFIEGVNFAQEKICESEILQKIRSTKSDAEARRIIRTLLK